MPSIDSGLGFSVAYDEAPPNYDQLLPHFPLASKPGVIFTYGRTVYVPRPTGPIPPAILAHEGIHSRRQGNDTTAAEWWAEYIADIDFRFAEELLAHRVEYEWFKCASRNERRVARRDIAKRLSSPLYGNIV